LVIAPLRQQNVWKVVVEPVAKPGFACCGAEIRAVSNISTPAAGLCRGQVCFFGEG
jgi:hypothetical protein